MRSTLPCVHFSNACSMFILFVFTQIFIQLIDLRSRAITFYGTQLLTTMVTFMQERRLAQWRNFFVFLPVNISCPLCLMTNLIITVFVRVTNLKKNTINSFLILNLVIVPIFISQNKMFESFLFQRISHTHIKNILIT